MASIGTLKQVKENKFEGRLLFATFRQPIPVSMHRVNKVSDNAPDFRMIAKNGTEVGAAWIKQNKQTGKEYISVSISIPELNSVVYGTLGKMSEQNDDSLFSIIWNQPNSAIPSNYLDQNDYGADNFGGSQSSYDQDHVDAYN